MFWNYQRIAFSIMSALVLFSFHAGPKAAFASSSPGRTTPPVLQAPGHGTSTPALAPTAALTPTPGTAPAPGKTVKTTSTPYTIYLTFDDGPCAGSDIVNGIAQKDQLLINVFLIGKNVYDYKNGRTLLQEYKTNPLIEVGNHSFTHAGLHYRKYFGDPEGVLADFNRNRDSIGFGNRFARLPGRNFFRLDSLRRNDISTGKEAADTLAGNGYQIFGWDIEWRKQASPGFSLHDGKEMLAIVEKMLQQNKTFLPGQLIMLLHDPELKDDKFHAHLEDFINLAKADGRFRFEHLSNYPL